MREETINRGIVRNKRRIIAVLYCHWIWDLRWVLQKKQFESDAYRIDELIGSDRSN